MKYFLTLTNELGEELDKNQVETNQTATTEADSWNLDTGDTADNLCDQLAMCIDMSDRADKEQEAETAREEAEQERLDAISDSEMEDDEEEEDDDGAN